MCRYASVPQSQYKKISPKVDAMHSYLNALYKHTNSLSHAHTYL